MLGIAKIESWMPVVRACQIGTRHHGLGLAGLKWKSCSALRLNNGRNGGFAIHFDDSQQLPTRAPHFESADILPLDAIRNSQAEPHHGAVPAGDFGGTLQGHAAFPLQNFSTPLR